MVPSVALAKEGWLLFEFRAADGRPSRLPLKCFPMRAEKLAIDGGPKTVRDKLPPWPCFDEKAIKAVEEVLRSGKVNYWTGRRGMAPACTIEKLLAIKV